MKLQGRDIETVFKVVPPLTEIKDGHGYLGVMLRDRASDEVQCHECGKWAKSVGKHSQVAHDVSADEYRYKFGLPLGFPLCARSVSKQSSDRALRLDLAKNLTGHRLDPKKLNRMGKKQRNYSLACMALKNKRGACPEQIERRYAIVSDMAGKEASLNDILKYDPPLRDIILRRHGTFNKFKKAIGGNITERSKECWEENEIIASLRKYALKNQEVPTSFSIRGKARSGYPSYNAVRRVFGSWTRALSVAGFDSWAKP